MCGHFDVVSLVAGYFGFALLLFGVSLIGWSKTLLERHEQERLMFDKMLRGMTTLAYYDVVNSGFDYEHNSSGPDKYLYWVMIKKVSMGKHTSSLLTKDGWVSDNNNTVWRFYQ